MRPFCVHAALRADRVDRCLLTEFFVTFSAFPRMIAGKQALKSTSFGDASLSTHSSSSNGSRTVSYGKLLVQ